MGRHERPGWIKRKWNNMRARAHRENAASLRNNVDRTEVKKLRQIDLPSYVGHPPEDIPDYVISSSVAETFQEVLKERQTVPYHMRDRVAEATISFITTNPDHVAAFAARVPEAKYQRPSERPLLDQYAFSTEQVLDIRDQARQYMSEGQQAYVTITFVADRPHPRKPPVWSNPIISLTNRSQS